MPNLLWKTAGQKEGYWTGFCRGSTLDLVSFVRVVVEPERETESGVVLLQQRVSVSALVQGGHCGLQLLEARLLCFLDAPPAGQVAPHHPLHGQVETQVAALPRRGVWWGREDVKRMERRR